jgi:hypothetical protein
MIVQDAPDDKTPSSDDSAQPVSDTNVTVTYMGPATTLEVGDEIVHKGDEVTLSAEQLDVLQEYGHRFMPAGETDVPSIGSRHEDDEAITEGAAGGVDTAPKSEVPAQEEDTSAPPTETS